MNAVKLVQAFSIDIVEGATAVEVILVGDGNMNAVERLQHALADAHSAALRRGVTEVIVDVRQLEFMNSACFKQVVTWISRVEAVVVDRRYRIRFVSNAKIHWQRRSLHALRMFAVDLVSVDA